MSVQKKSTMEAGNNLFDECDRMLDDLQYEQLVALGINVYAPELATGNRQLAIHYLDAVSNLLILKENHIVVKKKPMRF